MKKVFKWIGIVLGSQIGLVLVVGAVLSFIGKAPQVDTMVMRRSARIVGLT